ncbi:hypothetical protein PTI98_013494 [Pleurotus ostreatus]|nr:hypothetical protein PTI98_013494 [Pleurotus ostreatus]
MTAINLTEPAIHKATLLTLHDGALPISTTSLYCRKCFTRYHHNYLVHDQTSRRQYYPGVPDTIQVAKHYFIEAQLLELIAVGKVFGCARMPDPWRNGKLHYDYGMRMF